MSEAEGGGAAAARDELRAAADLVGRLLLRELEPADLARWRAAGLVDELARAGLVLPDAGGQAEWLDERAAEFHDLFLRPESGPLVQSLWTQGRYEGDATVRVRQLAEHAGLEFQRGPARGAAVDHLGSLLLMWAATSSSAPPVADELVREHLEWARAPLTRIARRDGFYGAVAKLALATLDELAATLD